jgi:hypothetical protein
MSHRSLALNQLLRDRNLPDSSAKAKVVYLVFMVSTPDAPTF